MTIICVKDGIMAADSLLTAGDIKVGYRNKIYSDKNYVIGASGYSSAIAAFIKWIMTGKDFDDTPNIDKNSNEFNAIIYNKQTKTITLMDELYIENSYDAPFYALGTGAEVAKGAMAVGATAVEAVKAAIMLNTACGGTVTRVILK